jgi:cell wall-associated NlpC family hydrolase
MIDVPHCRDVKLGTRGVDVVAYKRALSRAGFMKWGPFTNFFGPFAEQATKAFQHAHGIMASGVIAAKTHHALEQAKKKGSSEPAFDSLARHLLGDFCAQHTAPTDAKARAAAVAAAYFWKMRAAQIGYSQARPFPVDAPPQVPANIDCSGFVTICYFAGRAKDPNGRGYDGFGYTGTLLSQGTKIPQSSLKAGDLVFYGSTMNPTPGFPRGSPTHVAIYVGQGMVISMGSQAGPFLLSVGYRPINCCATYAMV